MGEERIIGKGLLLAVVSVVSVLAILELGLRVLPKKPTPDPMGDRSLYFYAPDAEHEHPWSHGRTNDIRIAVIGDSFTEGVGVQLDYRYANCLERLLNMKAGLPDVMVKVFSLSGSSTFQQLSLLDEAMKWKANIVVLGICLNDMEDWANPKELMEWREQLMPSIPPSWIANILGHSRILSLLYTKEQQAAANRGEIRYYQRLYVKTYSGVGRFREAIALMNSECREAHATFVPMIFPLLSEPFQQGRYPFDFAHEAIQNRCKELHLDYLDLLPAFRNVASERVQVIPGYDPHPNEIAHRIAAETLLQYLLDHKIISRKFKPDERASQMALRDIWKQTIHRLEDPISEGRSEGVTKTRKVENKQRNLLPAKDHSLLGG